MPKSPLALLLAMSGPKGRNQNGVTDSSIADPDQGGSAMAPEGEDQDDNVEEVAVIEPENEENCFTLPPGFKASTDNSGLVTTTIQGKIVGDKFYPSKVGDMPMTGAKAEMVDTGDEPNPMEDAGQNERSPELVESRKKRMAEKEARDIFQPRR